MAENTIGSKPRTKAGPAARGFRLGLKAELAALGVLIVVVAAVVAQVTFTKTYSPEGAVRDYLSALDRGDAAGALAASVLEANAVQADAQLLSRSDLAATLAASKPSHQNLTVTGVKDLGKDKLVSVAYDSGGSGQRTTYQVRANPTQKHFGLYPLWQVVLSPALISAQLPAGAGALSVDGKTIETSTTKATTIAVFPGQHHLQVAASGLFNAASADVSALHPAAALAAFKLTLTDAASKSGVDSVQGRLQACALAVGLAPQGCPFGVIALLRGTAQWRILGTPDATISIDDKGQIVASGHVLTDVRFQGDYPNRAYHRVIGGPYQAALSWDGQKLNATAFSDGKGVADLTKPSVADSAVLSALAPVFAHCLAITSLDDLDCPQSAIGVGTISNLAWKQNSDPMAGAQVSYDPTKGLFQVKGSYSMTATFDQDNENLPTMHEVKTDTGSYTADLYWDGQKPVFITFV